MHEPLNPSSQALKGIVTGSPLHSVLTGDQLNEADYAENSLAAALRARELTHHHLAGDVVDFGCGYGGSSVVLALNGGRVTAVEHDEMLVRPLRHIMRGSEHFGFRHPVSIANCDGIKFLRDLAPHSVDLITAFGLGKGLGVGDHEGALSRDLVQVARAALKEDGRLLVYSDARTIEAIKNHSSGVTLAENLWVGRPPFNG